LHTRALKRTLKLVLARDDISVGLDVDLDLGVGELHNLTILAVEEDLIDGLKGVKGHTLEGSLELGVVTTSSGADNLSLSADGALTSSSDGVLHLGQLLGVHFCGLNRFLVREKRDKSAHHTDSTAKGSTSSAKKFAHREL
jgi:hypothetical protein